jgi:NAD(P)-dependent dehydrogenase (short-subunit alcohol dehydrogenase family)
MARFEGKSVVIIGGNSGIGRAAAEAFAAEGAQIAIAGPRPGDAGRNPGGARRRQRIAVQADIADLDSLDRFLCRMSRPTAAASTSCSSMPGSASSSRSRR